MRISHCLTVLAASVSMLAADEDWISFGESAAVHKTGKTATLDYNVAPGHLGMAILQVGEGKLAGMTHLQFRVKTDVSTILAVLLSEKKPGDYTAIFWSPKDQWQQIDLVPSDFAVNDGPKDPKDPDGRLDVDQVQSIALLDAGQFFSQMPRDQAPIAVMQLSGDHKLEWEDYRVLMEPAQAQARAVVIDDFHRAFLPWITPGGGQLALSKSGNPLGKPALEFRYEQGGKLAVLMHPLGQLDLTGMKELSFDMSSTHDAHVLITLEKQKVDGRAPRYNHDFTVSAGQTGHMSIPFSEFTLADDSPPDPAGHLELNRVRSPGIVDVSGMLDNATGQNTLWIAEVKAR